MNSFKNYLYNLSYRFLVILLPLITTPYVSRVLEAEGVGQYAALTTVSSYFIVLGILGLENYGTREMACIKDQPENQGQLFWEISLLKIFTMGLSLIAYVLYATCFVREDLKILYYVQSIAIVTSMFDPSWLFQGQSNFRALALKNILARLASVALIFLLVKRKEDLILYVIIASAPVFLSNVFLLKTIDFSGVFRWQKPGLARLKFHLKKTMGFWFPPMLISFYTALTKIVLNSYGGDAQLGVLENADKLVRMLLMIITAFTAVMTPKMCYANEHETQEQIIDRNDQLLSLVAMLACPIACGIAGISDTLVPWFMGPGYEQTAVLLKPYALLLVLNGINAVLENTILIASRQEKKVALTVFAATVINVVLNFALIPRWLAYGTCAVILGTETSILLLLLWMSRGKIHLSRLAGSVIKYGLLSLLMGGAVACLGQRMPPVLTTTLLQCVLGVGLYGAALLLLRDSNVLFMLKTLKGARRRSA